MAIHNYGAYKTDCLAFDLEKFGEILSQIYDTKVWVSVDDGDVHCSYDYYEQDLDTSEILEKLGDYFGIRALSIHSDAAEYPLVWIPYKDDNSCRELPTTVVVNIDEIGYDPYRNDVLDDCLSDYLSDNYGFCHQGFDFETDSLTGDITIHNIHWDVDFD